MTRRATLPDTFLMFMNDRGDGFLIHVGQRVLRRARPRDGQPAGVEVRETSMAGGDVRVWKMTQ